MRTKPCRAEIKKEADAEFRVWSWSTQNTKAGKVHYRYQMRILPGIKQLRVNIGHSQCYTNTREFGYLEKEKQISIFPKYKIIIYFDKILALINISKYFSNIFPDLAKRLPCERPRGFELKHLHFYWMWQRHECALARRVIIMFIIIHRISLISRDISIWVLKSVIIKWHIYNGSPWKVSPADFPAATAGSRGAWAWIH